MSLNIHNITFGYPSRDTLFTNVSLSVASGEKASLIGDNGSGKSTLLRIVGGELKPLSGEIVIGGRMWCVPQHFGQYDHLTISGALGIQAKLLALRAIVGGDGSEENYAALADDWNIEENALAALARWGLEGFDPDRPFSTLSGGEKTKVFLAGITLHSPDFVLMDEPTNHLDAAARRKLYDLIRFSHQAILVVSHDRALLELVGTTWELTPKGAVKYGGNYRHYKDMRDAKANALERRIGENEKALKSARRTLRESLERQSRRESAGTKKSTGGGIPRIMVKTLKESADATTSKLKEAHSEKIAGLEEELRRTRGERPADTSVKIKFGDSGIHKGKTLVEGRAVNFSYGSGNLWPHNFGFRIGSGDRIAIAGPNGCGKSTLVRLITGDLDPTEGEIRRAPARIIRVDQQYSLIDDRLTVAEQAAAFNARNLPEHIVKTELHRFLFPADTWDKPCAALSGGEKMKLTLCSLIVGDNAPDMFILDEPTNNLDIRSLEMVTEALRGYRGTVAVISHDARFTEDIGVTKTIIPGQTLP